MFGEDRNSQTDGTFPVFQESIFIRNSAAECGGAICTISCVCIAHYYSVVVYTQVGIMALLVN